MKTHNTIALIVIGLTLNATLGRAADLVVRLDAHDVARKRVHTDITLAVKPGRLTLVFAKWLPGEHGPTGPIESMIGLEIKANGERLAWTRDTVEMYSLNTTVPRGVDHLDIAIESGLATEGSGFTAAPTSSENIAILPWNEFLLYPKGIDGEKYTTQASVIAPAGWSVATSLATTPKGKDTYDFESVSLARLIDAPVQMGRYARRVALAGSEPRPDLRHEISIVADSAAALETPPDFAAGYSKLVAEFGALFGSRMYRHYTWLLSLSDHVAHFGLEHHESSDDRRELNALSEPVLRKGLAALLAHEYTHSWNGKYRRPQGLLSPDFEQPMDGSLLWVYEGMTQFWEYVIATRAGLLTPADYRDYMAEELGDFDVEVGARWRPLGDTAVAAQLLYVSPDAWISSRRDTDFYDASMLLWLDVDAELRARTQGRASLDDFVKRFYAGTSGAPQLKPYVEEDIYDALAALAPADWHTFIHRHLDSPDTKAMFSAIERNGWTLVYTAEKNPWISDYWEKRKEYTERQWSIGLRLDKDAKIIDVIDDRAAARAGAGPGMTVIAVNGHKYSADVLDAAIREAQSTRKPISVLVENDDFYRTLSVEYYDGPRFPHLVRIDGTPDLLVTVLAPRLH